jgi:hypothetical protein
MSEKMMSQKKLYEIKLVPYNKPQYIIFDQPIELSKFPKIQHLRRSPSCPGKKMKDEH